MNKEYKRNCPECDKIIEYNGRAAYTTANKKNCLCGSCCQTGTKHPMYGIRGANHYNYGKKRSKETRKKLSGDGNGHWKGGTWNTRGYTMVYQGPNKKYKLEHRIVMEKAMGRLLLPDEIVHHINEIKDDNRIDNLMLFKSNSDHRKWHEGKRDIKYIYPKEEKE